MAKDKKYDEIISGIMLELDTEHGEYQKLYTKFYGKSDSDAKLLHIIRINLCKRIRQELLNEDKV